MTAPRPQSIASLINLHSSRCVFDAEHLSGLEKQLPPGSRSHIVMPFSTHNRPALLLIASSSRPQCFPSSSINLIRSIGALLLARCSQDAVLEADTAKTIFLSSISHELRTPLHSMLAALRLALHHVQEREWESLEPLLEAMKRSSAALQGTLDDVLDFGMSQKASSIRPRAATQALETSMNEAKKRTPLLDVVETVRGAIQLCLMQHSASQDKEVVMTYESRCWDSAMNEAQFRR